ncbi:glycosyltransferase family 2 protein [Microvirga lenta]|uniref:glycosyltransferase family 2 protein n=1 Tax=Microvirga lenta TaxID=2881337 RepID=UPI001CFFEE9F|nr:glycosyltransferase [Microvirga lenta]
MFPSSIQRDQPLVSIILPCHLGTPAQAELLNQTLQTADVQTCQNYEIILVDDGSPVPAAPVASAYPRVTTVYQDNAGPAVARNTGISRSRGQYLVFLDADDHLLPCALAAGLDALERHPQAGFAVGPREEMTFEGEPVPWHVAPPPPQTHIYLPLLRFDWYIIPPSSVMFRREAVEAVGGFRTHGALTTSTSICGWPTASPPAAIRRQRSPATAATAQVRRGTASACCTAFGPSMRANGRW